MRFCGTFSGLEQLRGPKKSAKAYSQARERVRSALLAVDHADRFAAFQTRFAEGLYRLRGLPPEGHDVLHEADELTLLELTLEAVSRAVLLRLLADDQEGEA